MKKYFFLPMATAFLLSCNNDKKDGNTTTTDTTKTTVVDTAASTKTPPPPMDTAAMMKAWQAYMTPGDPQKRLAMANGKWNEETTMYMNPGTPQTTKGTCENSMIMNGLYQRSEHHGSYNGMAFEGTGTMAYNNASKKYQSTWIDNMGSGIMNMEGTYDDATKTYNMKGMETDPMTGTEIPVRETFKLIDDKTQFMEMFETRDGKETKSIDIKFTKQ